MELSLPKGPSGAASDAWGPAIAAAAASTLVATVARFALVPYLGPAVPFRLYFLAVAASAWLAGLRGGLVATGLAALAGSFFFLPPAGSLVPSGAESVALLVLFGAEASVISALGGSMRAQRRRAEANGALAREQVAMLQRALEERRRVERERAALLEQVAASERAYRLLAEAIPQLVWAFGPDGHLSYCNERARTYLGLGPEALRSEGWLPAMHPDDAKLYLDRKTAALESAEPFEVPARLRRSGDGAYRWHLVRFAVMREARGRPVAWVGTATDIHEQKRAEDAEHFLVRAGTDLAASRERGGSAECVARAALKGLADWCVVSEVDEATGGWRVAAVAHSDAGAEAAARAAAERYVAGRRGSVAMHGPGLHQGGARLVAEVGGEAGGQEDAGGAARGPLLRALGATSWVHVPLEANGRNFGTLDLGLVGDGRHYDELDLRVAERLGRWAALAIENEALFGAARREKQRAEEASRAKDEFLAIVSHELRTPLNAILGWIQLLQRGEVPGGEAGRALEIIARNARAQSMLIEDILDVARITTGKLRLRPGPVEPARLVDAALEAVRPAAEAKQIRLETADEAPGASLQADPDRLQQVVWNLLSNAIKFTPKGGKVMVRLRLSGGDLELVVSDTGRGIDASFLPFVFERFHQADGSSARAHGGLGLGLAIVKHIVELHGGTVGVDSEGEGQGAAFKVRLPAIAGEGPSAAL
ncbi:MAG TPA: ATP-binding protein [Polyangiaceae bacterium]|nr:ATP-binding protein [Polyangiaceae bacterium]